MGRASCFYIILHNVYFSKTPVSLLLLIIVPVVFCSDISHNYLKNKPVNTC